MVLAGKRWRSSRAVAGPIDVISCGVRVPMALDLQSGVPCARRNSGTGMRWAIGQDAMGVTVMQDKPCRIMAHLSGRMGLAAAERVVGTSGRKFR